LPRELGLLLTYSVSAKAVEKEQARSRRVILTDPLLSCEVIWCSKQKRVAEDKQYPMAEAADTYG
jgi:hypothetical protein